MTRVALLAESTDASMLAAADGLACHLVDCGFTVDATPAGADVVLLIDDRPLGGAGHAALIAGGVPVLLLGSSLAVHADVTEVVEATGVLPGRPMPVHEVRLRPGPDAGELLARVDGDLVVTDSWLQLDKVLDGVEVLLTAMSGLTEHAVMTWRPSTRVGVLTTGSRPQTLDDPAFRRLVHRWIRHALGRRDGGAVAIGLLGFGAIGVEHIDAIGAVEGLRLAAVCDKSSARLDVVRRTAPDVVTYADADVLLGDDEVDLVIVSTPPNTHAHWGLRALAAGKHVVVEKPFCLTTAEADEMIAAARDGGRTLAVYQNRRWDSDYLALKSVVRSGRIGEVFHYESFVGSYGHPCNFWHSDEEVSGGAVYDWGSHYLDWALDLLPQPVRHVTAAKHKRMWHDVSNADHSRVTIRFEDGAEAEFTHSDLAAAMKPKWFVLGTQGALVGHWRHERVLSRNPVGGLIEDSLAAAESPAAMSLHAVDGSVTALALPPSPRHPFHRELADLLLSGAPMSLSPESSRRNIAVMEAATVSAQEDGRTVTPL
jgi:predicted dehydrogenase